MLQTVQMWSEKDGAVVAWDVTLETTDDGAEVIAARHGDEVHLFSPSTTDAELEALAANIQTGLSAQHLEALNG